MAVADTAFGSVGPKTRPSIIQTKLPKGETKMQARLQLAMANSASIIRLSLVLVSLLALALGAGAPDDWGGHGGW
jgi:hypothetical protein